MFTKRTESAIVEVAEYCAADMEYEDAHNSEIMAEVALDASRLTTQGYKEADEEVSALIKEHGYDAVLKAAAKLIQLG